MKRMAAYPEYKDSGIEWLGKIPAHWEVARVGDRVKLVNGLPFKSEFFDLFNGTPLVRIRDLDSEETEVLYDGPIEEDAWIDTGDIIIGMDGDYNVARWRGKRALLNQRMCSLQPLDSTDVRFLRYFLPYPLDIINDLTYSTTVKHLSSSQVRKILFGAPSLSEQRAIAGFLDRKTVKIDALVEKKGRLIELLQEKRTALIARAVTKGLDPNVPTKDSGVEWLGQIPAHWKIVRVKNIAAMRAGTTITSEEIDERGEYPVYGGNGLRGYTSSFTHEGEYVLVGRQGALCGNINYASGKFWASEHAVVATPLGSANVHWLGEVLRSMRLNELSVAAAQPGLAVDRILSQSIALPPNHEQRKIANFLDRETAKIDALIAKVGEAIERLKEYRTALISAAVTGKIDVRNE